MVRRLLPSSAMLAHLRFALPLALLALAPCACAGRTGDDLRETSTTGDAGPSDGAADSTIEPADAAVDVASDAPLACAPQATSSLPHVHIDIHPTKCAFTLAEAAAGITIAYDLVVDEDVPGFVPASPYPYGVDVANLDLTEEVAGNGQAYCLCDLGIPNSVCPLPDGGAAYQYPCGPITLPKGVYAQTFSWDGRNWNGPSDTMNPKGPPFPPGDYVLTIETNAGSFDDAGPPVRAQATLPLRIVP